MKKLLLLSVSLPCLVATAPALAQDGQADDTITVVGSRVAGRTALQSNVPVDVIQAGELAATPSMDLKDAMRQVSPSFEAERNAVSDGDSFVRQTSLRGLDAGQIIVLLNGKRVHRSAILIGSGYQVADLGTFSVNSLKSVSILRDGAAAQYGADAVAGVIDLTLDDSEGISGEARYSKYYEGDGAGYEVASKVGLNLADRGFLTITAAYGHQNPTNRALQHLEATDHVRRQMPDYQTLNPHTIAPFGIAERTNFNLTWNAEMEVNENMQVYTFGNFASSNIREPFNYRPALTCNTTNFDDGVRTGPGSRAPQFVECDQVNLTANPSGNPSGSLAATGLTIAGLNDLYGSQASKYYYLAIDGPNAVAVSKDDNRFSSGVPVGFNGLEVHPNGFNPWFLVYGQDIGAYAGIKGEFDNGLTWDLSGSVGRNRLDNYLEDSINPSLGAPQDFSQAPANAAFDYDPITGPLGYKVMDDPDTVADESVAYTADDFGAIDYDGVQTEFYAGSQVNIERSIGLDMGYAVDTDAVEQLNIAWGAEYRSEQIYNIMGEQASWRTGPLSDLNVGSNGYQGADPGQKYDASRHNYAFYVDVDSDITDVLNVAVAARYEDFSDFGDNLSWKIAGRWQVLPDLLAVRGAVSTGFHAPSVGQINRVAAFTGFSAGTQTYVGTFPASSVIGQILGAEPLRPEKAKNLSAGFVFTPGDSTNLTVDFFNIQLNDRIRQSRDYRDDNAADADKFAAIVNSGINGAENLTRINFFVNSMDTRTRGIEAVATHNIDFDDSSLKLVLAYAHVSTRVTRADSVTTSAQTIFNVEHDTAPHKATLSAAYNVDAITITGRARYYHKRLTDQNFSSVTNADRGGSDLNPRIDENPGRVFFDLSVNYEIDDQFSVMVGADNILNTYPEKLPLLIETSQNRGRQYLTPGPDWQGGSYYIRAKANF